MKDYVTTVLYLLHDISRGTLSVSNVGIYSLEKIDNSSHNSATEEEFCTVIKTADRLTTYCVQLPASLSDPNNVVLDNQLHRTD